MGKGSADWGRITTFVLLEDSEWPGPAEQGTCPFKHTHTETLKHTSLSFRRYLRTLLAHRGTGSFLPKGQLTSDSASYFKDSRKDAG